MEFRAKSRFQKIEGWGEGTLNERATLLSGTSNELTRELDRSLNLRSSQRI